MNRFKLENKPLFECSKLQQDFIMSNILVSESSKNLNPNTDMLEGDSNGKSKPIDILYRRYIQLKDAWHNKQPTNFKNSFELNTYCSEALSYVARLETLLEGVKGMYREHWYREQYKTMSRHGFHALLAGTHSVLIIYKFLKFLFYLYCLLIIVIGIWIFLDENSGLKLGDTTNIFVLFGIWMGLKFSELVLNNIFGKNHQQIIRDKIRQSDVPENCYSAHLLTIGQDIKRLQDDIDFFQQQWIKKLDAQNITNESGEIKN